MSLRISLNSFAVCFTSSKQNTFSYQSARHSTMSAGVFWISFAVSRISSLVFPTIGTQILGIPAPKVTPLTVTFFIQLPLFLSVYALVKSINSIRFPMYIFNINIYNLFQPSLMSTSYFFASHIYIVPLFLIIFNIYFVLSAKSISLFEIGWFGYNLFLTKRDTGFLSCASKIFFPLSHQGQAVVVREYSLL